MTLRERQSKFMCMLGLLIHFAYERGYELTGGDLWAKTGHMDNSLHYSRLAIDLNLFKDGKYLRTSRDHKELGEFWESLGGSWGGRFGESEPGAADGYDGNHYSLSWGGRK